METNQIDGLPASFQFSEDPNVCLVFKRLDRSNASF